MQEHNVRLDKELVQLRVTYTKEKKQRVEEEEHSRVMVKAYQRGNVILEKYNPKAKAEVELWRKRYIQEQKDSQGLQKKNTILERQQDELRNDIFHWHNEFE